MGCSGRTRREDLRPEQKWDFISLNDFKSTSCWEPLAYAWLWGSLIVSVAVSGVDTFTAVQLLAFSKWSSEVIPQVPFDVSKWIFAICIILSWVNLGYEHWRAWRVMKRDAVAESYLDSLAVRLQCIRMGRNGHGWRRFLVFAELTKSKKGVEYVALFTYFSFQSWIRVIFCSGPRQVVNALTLWAVFQANLNPQGTADAGSSLIKFFKNIGLLADKNKQQAVILSGMLFTLVIWVFAALSLLIALLFYLLFLWHYIPNSDRGLSGYCERKINGRLTRIVSAKVNKALEDEERKRLKDARKAVKKGDAPPVLGRQATLPTLFNAKDDDKLPDMPMLHRNDTMSTLPLYTSRPGTPSSQQPSIPNGYELNNMGQKRPFPSRTETTSTSMSGSNFASDASLIGSAAEMGYGRSDSPAPTIPSLDTSAFPMPGRSMTENSNSQWQRGTPPPMGNGPRGPPSRQMTQDSYSSDPKGPPSRQMTSNSYSSDPRGPPSRSVTQDSYSPGPGGPPARQNTQDNFTSSPISYGDGRESPRPVNSFSRPLPGGPSSMGRRTPFAESGPEGRSSPAPDSDRNSSGSGSGPRPLVGPSGYMSYNPQNRSASAGPSGPSSTAPPQQQQQRPYRNMTEPVPGVNRQPTGDYFSQPPRQGTPQSQRSGSPASFNGRPGPPQPPQQQSGYQQGGYQQGGYQQGGYQQGGYQQGGYRR